MNWKKIFFKSIGFLIGSSISLIWLTPIQCVSIFVSIVAANLFIELLDFIFKTDTK
jgi:hypothetical protein